MLRIHRRPLLITAAFVIPSLAIPNLAKSDEGTEPGDYGYRHKEFHPYYQIVFDFRCSCTDGHCRQTVVRCTQLGSKLGYDVMIKRRWWAIPDDVYQPDQGIIPTQLRNDPAHVCAYDMDGDEQPSISCIIINDPRRCVGV